MKYLSMILAMLTMSVFMVSCGNDDDDESKDDLSNAVAGVYSGKLTVNSTVTADAYIVTISKISSTIVSIEADFLSSKTNFNVEKESGQYSLTSKTVSGITISVTGKTISISFLNKAGTMTTYIGTRD